MDSDEKMDSIPVFSKNMYITKLNLKSGLSLYFLEKDSSTDELRQGNGLSTSPFFKYADMRGTCWDSQLII
jgi:hypothetical protein